MRRTAALLAFAFILLAATPASAQHTRSYWPLDCDGTEACTIRSSSGYVNFGDDWGSAGYGIRVASGVLQVKNSGGTWARLSMDPLSSDGTNLTLASGQFRLPDGTAAAPVLAWETNTGIYQPEANSVGITIAGNRSGLVGTGTTTLYGYQAGAAITTGEDSTAIGYQALKANTTGRFNQAIGYQALTASTTGSWNAAYGHTALAANTTGGGSTAVGYQAAYRNTTGAQHVAVGDQALFGNTTGDGNTAIGYGAMYTNSTGSHNVIGGFQAVGDTTVAQTQAITQNTAFGYRTMFVAQTGADNNAAFGYLTLYKMTTGAGNVALGASALSELTTGSNNVAAGFNAGLSGLQTGSGNVFLGYYAGAYETGSNTFYVNNQNRTNTANDKTQSLMYGVFAADPANQTLTLNASLIFPGTVPTAGRVRLANGASLTWRGAAAEEYGFRVSSGTVGFDGGANLPSAFEWYTSAGNGLRIASGNWLSGADNGSTVGATGANRPSTYYAGTAYVLESAANGAATGWRRATTTVNASAGTTITATNLIPAGSLVFAVVTRVTTAFGVTNGLTSISLGDGTDADRWGNAVGIALGGATDMRDFTITSPVYYTSATSVVVTGNGGTGFDTTGQIRITVFYLDSTYPTS